MRRIAALALAALPCIAAASLFAVPAPAPTYTLLGVTDDGNIYEIDTGLSADDCRYYVSAHDMRYTEQLCEREAG